MEWRRKENFLSRNAKIGFLFLWEDIGFNIFRQYFYLVIRE